MKKIFTTLSLITLLTISSCSDDSSASSKETNQLDDILETITQGDKAPECFYKYHNGEMLMKQKNDFFEIMEFINLNCSNEQKKHLSRYLKAKYEQDKSYFNDVIDVFSLNNTIQKEIL